MKLTEPKAPPMVERISQYTPEQVRLARKRAGLSQAQATALVADTVKGSYRTWQGYETPVGDKNHRVIPLAVLELFLLLTNQHPSYFLTRYPTPAAPTATEEAAPVRKKRSPAKPIKKSVK